MCMYCMWESAKPFPIYSDKHRKKWESGTKSFAALIAWGLLEEEGLNRHCQLGNSYGNGDIEYELRGK